MVLDLYNIFGYVLLFLCMLFILVSFCNISHNLFEEVQKLKTFLMMNVQMKTQEIDSCNGSSTLNMDFRI